MAKTLPRPHFVQLTGDRQADQQASVDAGYAAYNWCCNYLEPAPAEHKAVLCKALSLYIDSLQRGRGI